MDNTNNLNPKFIYKLLGAKQLKLKFSNLSINSHHNLIEEFDINKIKKITVNKGLIFDDLNIITTDSNIKFKKLTRDQSNYL